MGPEQGNVVPFLACPLAQCLEPQDELPRGDTTLQTPQHGGGMLLSQEDACGLGRPWEPTQGAVHIFLSAAVPPAPATPTLLARWP